MLFLDQSGFDFWRQFLILCIYYAIAYMSRVTGISAYSAYMFGSLAIRRTRQGYF